MTKSDKNTVNRKSKSDIVRIAVLPKSTEQTSAPKFAVLGARLSNK